MIEQHGDKQAVHDENRNIEQHVAHRVEQLAVEYGIDPQHLTVIFEADPFLRIPALRQHIHFHEAEPERVDENADEQQQKTEHERADEDPAVQVALLRHGQP
ncbi:hypothetical protein PACILC2_24560 [Paenibacillus cisolokensis]|uniref:Uncharacterized protein n=1 Tax=Paenibacillus cisolokensis TaxID=1658519 RepID=A0ABQ4N7H6_9BACL|nr:hypothetical protein [Paenibacillus cisolokensis]GIQ63888.1 hypothetical protein PACILC2_24560 [Paenibacillus cisolokensis]